MNLSHFHIKAITFLIICTAFIGLSPESTLARFESQEQGSNIRVVIKEIEPFVFIQDGEDIKGFSIDLWKEIALSAELPFEFIIVETVEDQINALENNHADVAIAAISMTPQREELIDFSYPYYRSGLQIMAVQKPMSVFDRLLGFIFSSRFLWGIAGLFVILIFIGHIIWFLEHKTNPDFPKSYWKGIWEGLWWASVTVTTVGYGDKRVNDKWGRLLAIFWMFAGLFLIANFTAFVTAEATISRLETTIRDIDDLHNKRVVAVTSTTSAEFLEREGIAYRSVDTVDTAYSLLENEVADAMVYDAPVLQYYLAQTVNQKFQLVGSPFNRDTYGIALASDSPLKEDINKAILEIQEDGTLEVLGNKWGLELD